MDRHETRSERRNRREEARERSRAELRFDEGALYGEEMVRPPERDSLIPVTIRAPLAYDRRW